MADGAGVPGHGGEGAEVAEDGTQVVEYATAINVAKGSGMVCAGVPGFRTDHQRQKTWPLQATFTVTSLMDHLRSGASSGSYSNLRAITGVSWHYPAETAGLEVWMVNARDVKHLSGCADGAWRSWAWPSGGPRAST
jgi:transposase